jgi:ribosome-associated toxin RatA of RatAB toxin-antitoxin module
VHTVHSAHIVAPPEVVFAIARDVESWPQLLPDYRWCRVLERGPDRLVFSMGGWVRGWPARWRAVQEVRPVERLIVFRHTAGITRGMVVEWRFASRGSGVDVEIIHDLIMPWPLIGRLVSDLIVGPVFIDHIARNTLEAVRARAEAAVRERVSEGAGQ